MVLITLAQQKAFMFKQALKRMFLILFPIGLFTLALFLTHFHPTPSFTTKKTSDFTDLCPFYLGLSFFPIREKQPGPLSFQKPGFLDKKDFIRKFQDFKKHVKNLSPNNIIFVFPLVLTKEEEWIVSQKTFFLSPSGERKEISHLSYFEIQNFYSDFKAATSKPNRLQNKVTPLKLETLFLYLPKPSHFLFFLKGSNEEKIIKNITKSLANKNTGAIYLSSSNEKLLNDLLTLDSDWLILRSFKTLLRREWLSVWPYSFKGWPGEGLIIPSSLALFVQNLSINKQKQKLFFLAKDPPYSLQDQDLIQRYQGLISSQPHLALRNIGDKKTCLIKH